MKVILNKDLAPLGEEGDVRDVARGYARNYLFPRGFALPFNEGTVKLFEGRREAIEARKAQKRADAAGIKEKLESLELSITMPAGANGKLYGAVTTQTIADELAKHNHQIERKRIELAAGANIKNAGKYKVNIKLYESAAAEVSVTVIGQEIKTETKAAPTARPARKRRDEARETEAAGAEAAVASAETAATAVAEAAADTASTEAQTEERAE
ncbi:MAG: 50S ribosomal protein L9 [Treponema sp.]|nr:50S ribosomal protein L9 [Treponema sp.]